MTLITKILDHFIPASRDFWSLEDDCFIHEFPKATARFIKIQLRGEECLHFKEFDCFLDKNSILDLSIASTSMSSIHKELKGDYALQKTDSICHSLREKDPWWLIDLGKATDFNKIKIKNRDDDWAHRFRNFSILISNDFESWECIYQNLSPENEIARYTKLIHSLQLILGKKLSYQSNKAFPVHDFLDLIITISGRSSDLDTAFRTLVAFLLTEEFLQFTSDPELKSYATWLVKSILGPTSFKQLPKVIQLKLAGISIGLQVDFNVLSHRNELNSLLRCRRYKGLWTSAEELQILERAAATAIAVSNRLAMDDIEKIIMTRHGMVLQGGLLKAKEEYLEALEVVTSLLATAGYTVILCYGTLLGAIREKGFIAHDDDVDTLVLLNVQSKDAAAREMDKLIALFQASGISCGKNATLNIHVKPLSNKNISVDLFPGWINGEDLHLYMEKMQLSVIPVATVLPVSQIDLYGSKFNAPNKPEEFLVKRYGESWKIPNRYFELIG